MKAVTAILSQGLLIPQEEDFPGRVGKENLRIARRRGEIAGVLGLIKMGQWFGGRSVPMTGITCVAVAPEHRSAGVATRLVVEALEEIHREGVPISVLYPAPQPVYRRAGSEQAGCY